MNKQMCINIVPNMLILKLTGMVSMAEDVQRKNKWRIAGFNCTRFDDSSLKILN